jgi:hypothetical protein
MDLKMYLELYCNPKFVDKTHHANKDFNFEKIQNLLNRLQEKKGISFKIYSENEKLINIMRDIFLKVTKPSLITALSGFNLELLTYCYSNKKDKLGKEIPMLVVYKNNSPIEIYPREERGKIITIKNFLDGLINPPTKEKAIAMVRTDPKMSQAVGPLKHELDWKAEWVEDRWYVIGLFESSWGAKFVRHATIFEGEVYVSGYEYSREFTPPNDWVISKAKKEWDLKTLYTRLTPETAIELVKRNEKVSYTLKEEIKEEKVFGLPRTILKDKPILDAVAELIRDDIEVQEWRFAFYVQQKDGSKAILIVIGLGGRGAIEGQYADGYGFGETIEVYWHWNAPLYLRDWIDKIAKERGWEEISNLR